MAKKREQIDNATIEKIRNAIRRFELREVRMIQSSSSLVLRDGELPEKIENAIESDGRLIKKHDIFVMMHAIRLDGAYIEPTEKKPLEITATYAIEYDVRGDFPSLSEKDLAVFARTVSLFHVWPFWREFVQTTTARMGLPTLTVPLYRVGGLDSATMGNKPIPMQKKVAAKKSTRAAPKKNRG